MSNAIYAYRKIHKGMKITTIAEMKRLQKDLQSRIWSVWEDAHQLLSIIGEDDRRLFGSPIKSPSMELCDNLGVFFDGIIADHDMK